MPWISLTPSSTRCRQGSALDPIPWYDFDTAAAGSTEEIAEELKAWVNTCKDYRRAGIKKYVSNGYELQVDAASRGKTSGHFPSIEGEEWT